MPRLEKLEIRGVRCFSPKDTNTINFLSPFTLIVGPNGSGKTTIIECLKFMTTGDLPPNSRSGAFIYDPKLAKEVDVKAEVTLSFNNSANERLLCLRSMQATIKKAKIESKTLETCLYKLENDKKILLCNKMADIDLEIPNQLGITNSILEDVIFCHQDESTWPLSDPGIMKKKLDEIFASSKYNKAILGLKTAKKELNSDLKIKDQQLAFFLKEKLKRDDITSRKHDLDSEILRKTDKLEIFKSEIERIQKNIDLLQKDLNIHLEDEKVFNSIKNEYNTCFEYIKIFTYLVLEDVDLVSRRDDLLDQLSLVEKGLHELSNSNIEEEFTKVEAKRKHILEHQNRSNKINSMVESFENNIKLLNEEKIKLLEDIREGDHISVLSNMESKIREKSASLEKYKEEKYEKSVKMNDLLKQIKEAKHLLKTLEKNDSNESSDNLISDDGYKAILGEKSELEERIFELGADLDLKQRQLDEAYKIREIEGQNHIKIDKLKEITKKLDFIDNKDFDIEIKNLELSINKDKAYLKDLEEKEIIDRQKIKNNKNKLQEIRSLCKKIDIEYFDQKDAVSKYKLLYKAKKDLSSFEMEIQELRNSKAICSHAPSIYINFTNLGTKKNCCPLCKKAFENDDLANFTDRLNRVIEKIPEKVRESEEKLNNLEKSFLEYKRHNEEVIAFNNCLEKIIEKTESIESIDFDEKEILEKIDDLRSSIDLNYKNLIDIKKEKQIFNQLKEEKLLLETEVGDFKSGANLEDIVSSKEKVMKKLNDLKIRQSKIDLDIKKYDEFKEIIESKRLQKELQEKIKDLMENLQHLNSESFFDIDKEIKALENLKTKHMKLKIDVENKEKRIKECECLLSDKEKMISNLTSKIGSIDNSIFFQENTYQLDEEAYQKILNMVMDHKNNTINLNQKLRNIKFELETTEGNIKLAKCKKTVLKLDAMVKAYDANKINALRQKIEMYIDKKNKTTNNESIIKGELKQMIQNAKHMQEELETTYRDCSLHYAKCSFELKALELSMDDLDKCVNALDKAIIDFHSTKIDEVNKILRNLWIETYKGNDIEYIELKAESSETKAYNYRMVMYKSGVEIDMRGRCSAGQKMIASILFRIALADTFSMGCNVLALDEPTTNLDKENIESLSYTLSQIIKDRKNVQLIVITHDEDFVNVLNREGVEYFYRLKRDSDGNGKIVKHCIYK